MASIKIVVRNDDGSIDFVSTRERCSIIPIAELRRIEKSFKKMVTKTREDITKERLERKNLVNSIIALETEYATLLADYATGLQPAQSAPIV